MLYLHERLVDVLEALGFLRQLLDNISAAENSLHIHPHALHHQPLLHYLADSGQLGDPAVDILPEGGAVSVAGHAAQRHLAVFQLLHQFCCLTSLQNEDKAQTAGCPLVYLKHARMHRQQRKRTDSGHKHLRVVMGELKHEQPMSQAISKDWCKQKRLEVLMAQCHVTYLQDHSASSFVV